MIPHDAALDAAYGSTAWEPFTRVTLISPTLAGGETQIVADTVEGTMTSSDTGWPRTTLEMTVPAGVIASETVRPVSPFGGRVVVEAGATIGGHRYTFQTHDLDVTESFVEQPSGVITIRAASQEARVNEARFDFPQDAINGLTSVAVRNIVSEALYLPGGPEFYPYTSTLTTDDTIVAGEVVITDEVWPVLVDLLDATGGEAYFRYDRRLILRDDPVIGSPVMALKVGDDGTIEAYRDIERWAFNRVAVRFTSDAGNVAVGLWENTNPATLTEVGGRYGKHTRLELRDVAGLPSQPRCDAFAASMAKRSAAPFRRIELDAVPAPWLEPGDTVAVTLLDGVTANRLVSGVRWPLSQLDPMTVTLHDSGL